MLSITLHIPSKSSAYPHGRLHGTLSGGATKGTRHMPLYWLCYRHNNQISVVIEPGASLIHARMRAALAKLDEGTFSRKPAFQIAPWYVAVKFLVHGVRELVVG